jgi:hypothetical protein
MTPATGASRRHCADGAPGWGLRAALTFLTGEAARLGDRRRVTGGRSCITGGAPHARGAGPCPGRRAPAGARRRADARRAHAGAHGHSRRASCARCRCSGDGHDESEASVSREPQESKSAELAATGRLRTGRTRQAEHRSRGASTTASRTTVHGNRTPIICFLVWLGDLREGGTQIICSARSLGRAAPSFAAGTSRLVGTLATYSAPWIARGSQALGLWAGIARPA